MMGSSQPHNIHPSGMACEYCHLAKDLSNQEAARKLISTQEKLCGDCHQDAITVSHPSGVYVSRKLPDVFPLDWKGDMTCSTCHDVHGRTPGLMRISDRGFPLCTQCHKAVFFQRMKDGAQSVMHSGHLDASRRLDDLSLDAYSFKCMECHSDETSVGGLSFTGVVARHGVSSVNHPVGVSYQVAEQYGGYHPLSLVSDRLLVPNGKVSCVSCHEGYSATHGKLLIDGEKLCYECHNL